MKNRIYPPFQEAQVHIDYKKGVDPFAGIVDLASDLEIIIKAGSWYTCESLGIKAQGEAKLLEQIKDKDYMPMLEEINKDLKSTGYSSTNNNLEAAQEIINKEE